MGDALGMPLEFVPIEDVPDRPVDNYLPGDAFGGPCKHLASGQWTDDTQMMLAILESLLAKGETDLEDIRDRFRKWAASDDQRFPGNACLAAARAGRGIESEGCGSIMRTLPLGFLVAEEEAVEIGRLTHVSENTDKWVRYLHRAVRLGPASALEIFDAEKESWEGGRSAWVVDTGMSAFEAALATKSFKEAVVAAVNMGGDTDSIGAVAGGLAGAWYGFEGIPSKYLMGLERGGSLRHMADMLYETFYRRFE